jgi:hypothetical protein
LKDASTNGLSAEAKAHGVGWWNEDAALKWARARGKLTAGDSNAASVMTGMVHKIKG